MGERTALEKDLRTEAEGLVASDAPDEEVLGGVVRLVHDAHPSWDWSGIYLMKDGVLVLGPSTAPADHDRIEVGEGVCGTAVSEDRNQVVEDVREVENYLAAPSTPLGDRRPDPARRTDRRPVRHRLGHRRGVYSEDEALLEELAGVVAPRSPLWRPPSRPGSSPARTASLGVGGRLAALALDVDVDEVALGGGRFGVVLEEPDLVPHAAAAQPRDAQTRVDRVGKVTGSK
jgi:hypothetical protein